MAKRNGGIIGKLNNPTIDEASGVWAIQDQFNSQSNNTWPVEPIEIDFLVIAGGGGGGANAGAPGGAGGFRTSYGPSGGGASAESKIALTAGQTYTVTVGAGGVNNGRVKGGYPSGVQGDSSSFSGPGITTISTVGGGYGAAGGNAKENGGSGGSGGGGASYNDSVTRFGGSGTANQGYDGGNAKTTTTTFSRGGGGGAGGEGADRISNSTGIGNPGPGVASTITASSVTYAEGGSPSSAVANTGNGGRNGLAGQSGIVVIRIPTANYTGTTTGSPTVTTDGSDTIMKFTSSGSYTA